MLWPLSYTAFRYPPPPHLQLFSTLLVVVHVVAHGLRKTQQHCLMYTSMILWLATQVYQTCYMHFYVAYNYFLNKSSLRIKHCTIYPLLQCQSSSGLVGKSIWLNLEASGSSPVWISNNFISFSNVEKQTNKQKAKKNNDVSCNCPSIYADPAPFSILFGTTTSMHTGAIHDVVWNIVVKRKY